MTFRSLIVSLAVLGSAGLVTAQQQVANVSSSSPFQLRGVPVNPGQGVTSWPALAGDAIQAGTAPVTITFPDGSTITLSPGSSAKVNLVDGKPSFQLLKGSATYALSSPAAVQLTAGNRIFTPTTSNGTLGGPHGGFWTPGHTAVVIIAAGAAAGLSAGVLESTSGGSSVSPH